jgi:hypothetical protein
MSLLNSSFIPCIIFLISFIFFLLEFIQAFICVLFNFHGLYL